MTNLPMGTLTAGQQKKLSSELYLLLGKQVKSYHKHYHMGSNSSVPAETAQELLHSVRYTLDALGGYRPDAPLETQLQQGQQLLDQRTEQVRQLHKLVRTTAPDGESQYRWETVDALGKFLQRYDPLHFAHCIPEDLDYPLLAPAADSLLGIDYAEFYVNCLWLENQLLHSFPQGALCTLNAALPPDHWEAPQNMCEQPLYNAIGRALLGLSPADLTLSDSQRDAIATLCRQSGNGLEALLAQAAAVVCRSLHCEQPALQSYASQVLSSLLPRLKAALPTGDLSLIFL